MNTNTEIFIPIKLRCPDCKKEIKDRFSEEEKIVCPYCNNGYLKMFWIKIYPRYVLLEGLEFFNRFFSPYNPKDDPTKSATGETWYKILGFADTVEEAQMKLYGRTYPLN